MPITKIEYEGDIALVTTKCPFCGKENEVVKVPICQFQAWRAGTLIQRAMSKLPARQREFLITGICGPCFPSDEDYD